MNFFDHQDRRRRNTKVLLSLFIIAVALINLSLYFLCFAIFKNLGEFFPGDRFLWDWKLFGIVTALTISLVIGGILYMRHILSQGGTAVAQRLGGRRVCEDPSKPEEKRLRNVVEEMAIASGMPVPEIYVLDGEAGINAFAAGYSPADAAIGVTKGALELFNRDELQGVVAHEFSHILHGDMRMNMNLTGLLHGLLLIGMIGRMLIHSGSRRFGRRRSDPRVAILGLGLMGIGSIGVLFGRMIKAAVSRQREFLADASSVQYTRNPDGISNALKKLGGYRWGSKVNNYHAEEASHMFFGYALGRSYFSMLSTHPSVESRIKLIDPKFDGKFPEIRKSEALPGVESIVAKTKGATTATQGVGIDPIRAAAFLTASQLSQHVGNPTASHVSFAHTFIKEIPEDLKDAIHHQGQAEEVVYALLLDSDEEMRKKQISYLLDQTDQKICDHTLTFFQEVSGLGSKAYLPLLDLAIPSLRRLSPEEFKKFERILKGLIKADEKTTLFEYVLLKVVGHHLGKAFRKPQRAIASFFTIRPLIPFSTVLLSALAYAGARSQEEAQKVFQAGLHLITKQKRPIWPKEQFKLEMLDQALDRISQATPKIKERILRACAVTVAVDQKMPLKQAELLRAIGDTLDCPIPPFLQLT